MSRDDKEALMIKASRLIVSLLPEDDSPTGEIHAAYLPDCMLVFAIGEGARDHLKRAMDDADLRPDQVRRGSETVQ